MAAKTIVAEAARQALDPRRAEGRVIVSEEPEQNPGPVSRYRFHA